MKVFHLAFTLISLVLICSCSRLNEKTALDADSSSDLSDTNLGSLPSKDIDSSINEIDSTTFSKAKISKNSLPDSTHMVLNDKNAIPFFFEYAQKHKENKVRITTDFGSFIIELFQQTPYHRANFLYLTDKGYFDDAYFHRIIPGFIIQGGNSDKMSTARLREGIGKYLLPPDINKGYKHIRGTVSMPSSDTDNPHKLASPYEFFIVTAKTAPHLDGGYTAFGRVISGMEVVDIICAQPTDRGEWPVQNIAMKAEIIE